MHVHGDRYRDDRVDLAEFFEGEGAVLGKRSHDDLVEVLEDRLRAFLCSAFMSRRLPETAGSYAGSDGPIVNLAQHTDEAALAPDGGDLAEHLLPPNPCTNPAWPVG